MNWKKWTLTFLLAFSVFFSVPNVFAQKWWFYSNIDDAGDSLANALVKRRLQDFSSFRDFWKNCRQEVAWLDTQPINQQMLDELSEGNISSLVALSKNPLSTDDFDAIASCLVTTYDEIKSRSYQQQNDLEESGSIGIYLDGDTKNSDFDIIKDIEKINEIIFSNPAKYEGTKNESQKKLNDFLQGKIANLLGKNAENSENSTKNSSKNATKNTENSTQNETTKNVKNSENLSEWSAMCTPSGNIGTAVNNMLTDDFLSDLNAVLGGKSAENVGQDYAEKIAVKNTAKNAENSEQNASASSSSQKDFTNKLPCNGVFCITITTTKGSQNLLSGGKWGNSIEDILDKHISKTEAISWSDLSAQKMTNNSFQLPFLNIKFAKKIAGGRVFMYNSPQITKTLEAEQTPQKKQDDFDEMYRCAMLEANLSTDEKKNASIIGANFLANQASNTENIKNLVLPSDPQDSANIMKNNKCASILKENFRKKQYNGFSSQINETAAFTAAMLEIINQILDEEKKLDTIPTQ